MKSGGKTSVRKIKGRERELAVLELRKSGASFAKIANHLSCSVGAAHAACSRALARLEKQSAQEAAELRRLDLERLDELLLRVWQEALNGNLQAIDRAVKILERRARLLGLDAPSKAETVARVAAGVAVQVQDMTPEDRRAEIRRLQEVLRVVEAEAK